MSFASLIRSATCPISVSEASTSFIASTSSSLPSLDWTHPLHKLSTTVYSRDNCPVKLLVAATPTSGPQSMLRKESLILANEDVGILTIERIFAPISLAVLTDCKTSAVSPLCEMATKTELLSIGSSAY